LDDTARILEAIASVKELFETKNQATNEKVDMVKDDVKRHGADIGALYEHDRERMAGIADIDKAIQPAISHVKNANKMTAAFIISSIGVLGAAFGKSLMAMFKGGAG
jgi:hypothetical protein